MRYVLHEMSTYMYTSYTLQLVLIFGLNVMLKTNVYILYMNKLIKIRRLNFFIRMDYFKFRFLA